MCSSAVCAEAVNAATAMQSPIHVWREVVMVFSIHELMMRGFT